MPLNRRDEAFGVPALAGRASVAGHRRVRPKPGRQTNVQGEGGRIRSWPDQFTALLRLAVLLVTASLVHAAEETNRPPADAWFTNAFIWPGFVQTQSVATAGFETLRAEDSAGRLKVFWSPAVMDTNAAARLFASADEPGHWPVRDWRGIDAFARGTNWEAKIPVDDVDVPVAYFLTVAAGGKTNYSGLRLTYPRELGLEEPTRIFWPFIEGFEEGRESWRLATPDCGSMKVAGESHNGLGALLVTVPAGQHSVTVGTTRIRGWRAMEPPIRGVGLWVRTRGGPARIRFALHANAFTTNQVVSVSSFEALATDHWQRVDVAFDSFPKVPLVHVDWFTLEFIAEGPREILIDDLQYLGPWKPE
jgi:hypothetical protein